MKLEVSTKNIKDEINQIRRIYPKLKDDSAFVFWFLKSYLVDSDEAALRALTGDTSDKNIDAIYIDEKVHQVSIVQGKFHQSENYNEKRNDVISLAELGNYPWEGEEVLQTFYSELDPLVRERFEELVRLVVKSKYELKLFYVTTGRCSTTIRLEAKERARQSEGPVEISIIDHTQVLMIFKDYLEGVAPAVPKLSLRISSEGSIQHEGVIHRLDPEKEIESWVFSMSAKDVGDMFSKVGVRLFARNIRGYLGKKTPINNAMEETIRREPHNFWYFNNGITIVCYDAKREICGGQDIIIVEKAQIINGQQTTRTLHDTSSEKANLLVKVIKISRHPGKEDEYDKLVNSIVRATNWQNHIDASDLVSNDYRQVFLERELRKRGYQYIRKRQTKSEARRLFGSHGFFQIDKRELAQAVAACIFDPLRVRKGREGLFEHPYYESIFGSQSIAFYLSRFWLMRKVQYAARGYPNRAYAKWLVLHSAWEKFSQYIGSGYAEQRFRYACEQEIDEVLCPLNNILVDIFRAALKFYRLNRGKGEQAKDISAFFLLSKLDQSFAKFWHSNQNPYRKRLEKKVEKFKNILDEVEIAE